MTVFKYSPQPPHIGIPRNCLLMTEYSNEENVKNMKRVLIIIVLLALMLSVFATINCSRVTKIGDILVNPSQYEGKGLTIKGTVGDTIVANIITFAQVKPQNEVT